MFTTICHVVEVPSENPYAFPAAWLKGVAVHHDRRRFRHLVVTLGPRNNIHMELERRGVDAFALGSLSRLSYPRALVRLVKLLRHEQVDIVQTHLFDPSILGLVSGRVARVDAVLVTRHHSDFTTLFDKPLHRWLDRRQAVQADLVIAASEGVRRSMVELEHVPFEHIIVHHYGFEFEDLRPTLTTHERTGLRKTMGVDGDGPLLAVVARLSRDKGHRYLLEAIPRVRNEWPGLRVVFVGIGPLSDELVTLAAELGLSETVSFLGVRGDAHRIIEASDLVVHPSLTEAFCNVIIEAMALERPLVATDVSGASEQIDAGITGHLVPPGDPLALSAAILKILSDPEAAARMASEARRRVVQRFSFPRMMRIYEETYVSVLDNPERR